MDTRVSHNRCLERLTIFNWVLHGVTAAPSPLGDGYHLEQPEICGKSWITDTTRCHLSLKANALDHFNPQQMQSLARKYEWSGSLRSNKCGGQLGVSCLIAYKFGHPLYLYAHQETSRYRIICRSATPPETSGGSIGALKAANNFLYYILCVLYRVLLVIFG